MIIQLSSLQPWPALSVSRLSSTFTGTLGCEGKSEYSTAKASSLSRLKNSRRNVPAHDYSSRRHCFSGSSFTLLIKAGC